MFFAFDLLIFDFGLLKKTVIMQPVFSKNLLVLKLFFV